MGELETRKYIGIDIGKDSVQLSIYEESGAEMREESFPVPPDEREDCIAFAMNMAEKYMECNGLAWTDFQDVNFTMEDTSEACRKQLGSLLKEEVKERFGLRVMTRFRAFVEYVFHQERAVWDRSTLLLDYRENTLRYILADQIRPSRQKAYRAVIKELDLTQYEIYAEDENKDYAFSKMMKQFLVKNPAHIIFLTGKGFEGNWMKKTLTYLCAGRRVFLGQNLYANGACLRGTGVIPLMKEGMLLMQGPEMVYHTIGVVSQEAGKAKYVPITSIGREWYNTRGTMDIILDKSQKVEFFYHNTKENEMECSSCEIKELPARPPKTTRIRIEVQFTSETEGVILLKDLGFGTMFPATGKVTVFPFSLIS
ncbi:MAG: DUF5716 family protein [Eubacteriales bacterium]|nr:DUF5716 family protein [Eubacteriales bacterium]